MDVNVNQEATTVVDTGVVNEPKSSFTMDEVNEMIRQREEGVKSEWMKKFDQKNTEFVKTKKQLEEIEKAKLSDQERIELEKKEFEETLKSKEAELLSKELAFSKSLVLNEKKLDKEYLDLISGQDVESFTKNIEFIEKKINAEVEKRVNEKLAGGYKPSGASNNNVSIESQIEELTKNGKLAEAIALKNKLYAQNYKQ